MLNRKQKKQELFEERRKIQDQLYKIDMEERLERNKSFIGKYFKSWFDVSNSYTLFIEPIEIDKFDILYGRYFKKYDDGDVVFSRPGNLVSIEGVIDDDMIEKDEITKEEYVGIYTDIISKLQYNKKS